MILALLVGAGATLVVQPGGPIRTLTDALAQARPGDRIVVRPGTYREPSIGVNLPVEILGEGSPVFLGGPHHTLVIRASGVTVRGLVFEDVIPSMTEDRAAILVEGARECRLEDNTIRNGFFGIYLRGVAGCTLRGNRIQGPGGSGGTRGNGIQLWRSREVVIQGNRVEGHRDGIYFEFSTAAAVRGNTVTGNQRYGLHFMRSDSCSYERNTFADNGAGAAVMYSRRVAMRENRFERNWGSAAYGLLLKEISDGEIRDNRFVENTVALYLDDSNRNAITGNRFENNGWAVRLLASASDNRFEGNSFRANAFDVVTNSRSSPSTFRANWWDRYRGYDLDRDGHGDVPFRPVRLFGLIVAQSSPALLLLRSPFVDLLDTAERILPMLTPETLTDPAPLMRDPAR
jgi:nitrous oxidase accessory protein